MFDDITFEPDLPGDPPPPNNHFQTKDLGCWLDRYVVTKDGQFIGPDGKPEAYHGMVEFYTYHSDRSADPRSDGMWWEYRAKFTDGKLVNVECIEISRCPFGEPRIVLWPRGDDDTRPASHNEKA